MDEWTRWGSERGPSWIFVRGRRRYGFRTRVFVDTDTVDDALVWTARPRLTDPNRVIGMKPSRFAFWLFELLGARPGDTLEDLFPGSGGIRRAWDVYASREYSGDASLVDERRLA